MIVEYGHDPNKPEGDGRQFREVPDGEAFAFQFDDGTPLHRRSLVCIATNIFEAHPNSDKPYDRRVGVELGTGFHHWLTPETEVVTVPLKVVHA